MYAALRDSYSALSLDKTHMKSHFRLASCLYEFKWYKEAQECLNQFCEIYKDHSDTSACETLYKDIEKAIKKEESANTNSTNSNEKLSDDESHSKNSKKEKSDIRSNQNLKQICESYEDYLKSNIIDYKNYFCGHCNVATDIKEASFIGEYV